MTDTELISQNILDMLYNRVCVRVGHDLDASPTRLGYDIWKIPLQELQKIEQNPLCADGIVLEEKKLYRNYINHSGSNAKVFHVLLTRLYMLVKYLHYDDPLYQDSMYKALLPNMGPFRAELSLHVIDDGIAQIRKLVKLVEAAKAEKPADSKATAQEPANRNTTTEESAEDPLPKDEIELQNIKFFDKVRLDFLLKLIIYAGADLEAEHGNKKRAAEVMHKITGLPFNTCRNFCSEPVVSQDTHDEELDALQKKINYLGINIVVKQPKEAASQQPEGGSKPAAGGDTPGN